MKKGDYVLRINQFPTEPNFYVARIESRRKGTKEWRVTLVKHYRAREMPVQGWHMPSNELRVLTPEEVVKVKLGLNPYDWSK